MPDDRLYRIALDDLNASGRWQDEGRECWFKGHLYDVVRQKAVSGRTYAFCMDDEKEAALIERTGAMTGTNLDLDQRRHVPHDMPAFPHKTGNFIIPSYTSTIKRLFRTGGIIRPRSRSRLPEFYREIAPRPPWANVLPFY